LNVGLRRNAGFALIVCASFLIFADF